MVSIAERITGLIKKIPGQVREQYYSLNARMEEPQSLIKRRKAARLILLGGLGLLVTGGVATSIYEQNRMAKENPWKFEKLGPDEIYLYSGIATVIPEANFFTSDQSVVFMTGHGILKTQYSPVIPPEKEGADPKKDSRVGFITDKGLLFALGEFVTIEGGSFIKAKKTNKPDEFLGPNGIMITTKPVK